MSYLILAAVDGSKRAPGVLRAAANQARAVGGRVILFRAIDVPPDYSPAGAGGDVDPLSRSLAHRTEVALKALAAEVPDLAIEMKTARAVQPWRAILSAAALASADLVVLGSHGYHGWDRILGTTAGKVVNHARCNVLVVHDAEALASEPPDV